MTQTNPVTLRFNNRAVLVIKSPEAPTVLQEVTYQQLSPGQDYGTGYSVTCLVEANPAFSGIEQLADTGCFVHAYTSSGSRFARVASLADMDYLSRMNNNSAEEGLEYRSNTFTIIYNDLDTAIASMPVIRDRVNSLYSDRARLMSSFFSPGQPVYLPLSDSSKSVQEQYVADFKDKRSARESMDSSVAEIQASYSVSKEKELAYNKLKSWLDIVVSKLNLARNNINSLTTNVNSAFGTEILSSLTSKISGMADSSTTATRAELEAIVISITEAMTSSIINSTPVFVVPSENQTLSDFLTAFYFEFNGQLIGLTQTVLGASAYSSNYLSQLKEAKKAQEAAVASEAAALANITRYCPDIDTSSL